MHRKPILVIYFEEVVALQNIRPQLARLEGLANEYHVLILHGNETKVELFSGEKIEPIEIEQLKQSLQLS